MENTNTTKMNDEKYCSECGKIIKINAEICPKCGVRQVNMPDIIATTTSGKAIASLVLSLLWIYGLGSLLAVIFGHIARTEIKNSKGRLTGGGLALAGLIIGYLSLGAVVIGIIAAIVIPKLV